MLNAAAATKTDFELEGSWGIVSMLKSLQEHAASGKTQTTVSENRYPNLIIDVFRMVISTLLASTGNNTQAPFLVHQVLECPIIHVMQFMLPLLFLSAHVYVLHTSV